MIRLLTRSHQRRLPDALPVLSPGRHRTLRRGACLMEYTSTLAGERWSDSPRCTEPVLAAVARAVNDCTSERGRSRLAVLASDLTTANGAGPDAARAVARRCLLTALPYADADRRRVLVVGLLGLERASAGQARGWHADYLGPDVDLALLACADDVGPAAELVEELRVGVREHARRALPVAVECAVATIAAGADDPDTVLHDLLADCLAGYLTSARRTAHGETEPAPAVQPAAAERGGGPRRSLP